jgi:hypothetical protein
MQKIGDNKIFYNTIEEILGRSHTALVLWDVIRAFTKMIFNAYWAYWIVVKKTGS